MRWTRSSTFLASLVVLVASAMASCGGAISETDLGLGGGGASSGGQPSSAGGTASGGTASGGAPSGGAPSGGAPSGGTASGGTTAMGGSPATGGTGEGGMGGTVYDEDAFVTVWNTELGLDGASTRIKLPLVAGGTYDFTVDWGDGTTSEIGPSQDTPVDHDYAEPGIYQVVIEGVLDGWSFDYTNDCPNPYYCPRRHSAFKLTLVEQWGSFHFGDVPGAFAGCDNLLVTATDTPDLSPPTTLARAFSGCLALTDLPSSGTWDTSAVSDMSELFAWAGLFDGDVSDWDTSNVTNMANMFYLASVFDGDITGWDTSNVTNMAGLFYAAEAFNQDISTWDISNVTNMGGTFSGAAAFNQDISTWDTSNVTEMASVFGGAAVFNQDISTWDTSSVTNMGAMFTFTNAFNQDISGWDTSNVVIMTNMFYKASAFDQDLGAWGISSLQNASDMFTSSALSTAKYDALLIGWAAQAGAIEEVVLGAGATQYTAAAVSARAVLTDDRGWIINDGGLAP